MKCTKCNQDKESTHKRRTNTAYPNEEENFTVECDPCFEDTEHHWSLMWDEYFFNRG